MKEILSKIKEGDILFVQVTEYDPETLTAKLDLRKKPQINGGLMAVNEGEVRSVVAGFEAKGFNRAMFATRQPGSVFKPVVFFAALQLGWTILDRIDNERRVFLSKELIISQDQIIKVHTRMFLCCGQG